MNKTRNIIIGAILLVVMTVISTAGITLYLSGALAISDGNSGSDIREGKTAISFDAEKVDPELVDKFIKVKEIIKKDYYLDVDENILLEGAIAGMADSLKDPYTVYFSKEQMKAFSERTEGSYVGIGVTVMLGEDGLLSVVEPFSGSPAEKEGIIQGDKIIFVDDTDVSGIRDEGMIISMIKGVEDTVVKITVYRPSEGKTLDFEIVRKRIKIVNIKSEVLSGGIGYIKINMFDNEIATYFQEHLMQLLSKGIKSLIIDLRDNTGGSYSEVVKMADMLLPEGTIVYTEDRAGKKIIEKSDAAEIGLPMVVLTNGISASASEILAGALKDLHKATIVGTKTFGKGLVQVIIPLSDGSGIKVTISRYFTPSGTSIHGVGIIPDVIVETSQEYLNKPVSQIPKDKDVQLIEAIKLVTG